MLDLLGRSKGLEVSCAKFLWSSEWNYPTHINI